MMREKELTVMSFPYWNIVWETTKTRRRFRVRMSNEHLEQDGNIPDLGSNLQTALLCRVLFLKECVLFSGKHNEEGI